MIKQLNMKNTLLALLLIMSVSAIAQKHSSVIYDDNAQKRNVPSFNAIRVSSAIDVYLTQANSNEVAVSANSEEVRDHIITEVEGGTLIIRMADNQSWWNWKKWGNYKAKAYVSVKELVAISATGASNIRAVNKIETPKLKVKMTGATDFKGEVEAGTLSISLTGASEFKGVARVGALSIDATGASTVELSGSTDDVVIDVTGASSVRMYDLVAKGASVGATGASNVKVNVTQLLKARATGASSIDYKGEPNVKESSSTGASSIRHKN